MKIAFVSIENGITAIGFRKMAAFAKSIHPDTKIFYISLGLFTSPWRQLLRSGELEYDLSKDDIENIASQLARADMVCFSLMTMHAKLIKKIINAIRAVNPTSYILCGGTHSIIHPEDAIQGADAICTGEGEYAFQEFLSNYKSGNDYTHTKNFWVNLNGEIIKNSFRPLNTPEDLEKFPHPLYGDDEFIFKKGRGFIPLGVSDYLSCMGLAYYTIWSVGCPYRCTYCSNSKFIKNDPNYRRLRYPSVDYIIAEVKNAINKHPHISSINFVDDSFMAIPQTTLEEFSEKWRRAINIPFLVAGVIPSYVQTQKVKTLIWAGMRRLRMGIQSGSDRILKFYKRPNKPGLILHSASIIAEFSNYMMPPAYDIIVDNPIETRQDVIDTLELLYRLPRPFMLNVCSLRVIPNTELEHELVKYSIPYQDINKGYWVAAPTLANAIIYMLVVLRPPRWLFDLSLKHVKPFFEEQPKHYFIISVFRVLWLFRRAYDHFRFMEFSVISGKVGYIFWKLGIIKFWHRNILKNPSDAIEALNNRG